MKTSFADTLLQLVEGVQPPEGSGLRVTELAVELPLEISTSVHDGQLVFLASAPHSRWQAGFLPPIQRTRMTWTLEE